jgi:hypothetical protein
MDLTYLVSVVFQILDSKVNWILAVKTVTISANPSENVVSAESGKAHSSGEIPILRGVNQFI